MARIRVNMNLIYPLLLWLLLIENSNGEDILGCGGFVKSHVPLEFSKIEIGLYTKEGSLKEKTECAPTNGYYFLPLYEKGEYVLKVHPPAGWSLEPSHLELNIDGVSDPCSTGQDVNFSFNGFGITGRVITAGQKLGPSGVSVQLINDKGDTRNTITTTGGNFHFTPVIPGKYTVKATHPRWKLEPSQSVVQVKEGNTVLPVGVLAVRGYDVKGSVTAFGSPIAGVHVLLYSKDDKQALRVEGCNTALLQGVPDSPICYSITDNNGEFSFGLVPAGDYKLLALPTPPGQILVTYNVKPDSVPFSVQHDSLYIKNAFVVGGYTVVGSVVGAGGGVSGARVALDGRAVGNTDAVGKFTLPNLQPATYTVSFSHEECEIEPIELVVRPSGPSSSAIARVGRWRVCGAVSPSGRRVRLEPATGVPVRVHTDDTGKWCTFLAPGVYTATVELSEQEQRDGLQLYPPSQQVSVKAGPVSGVSFSQLKGKVVGRVVCRRQSDCTGVAVTLRPVAPSGGYVGQPLVTHAAQDGSYEFSEVAGGSGEVSVAGDRVCWRQAERVVSVGPKPAALDFHQVGYVLRLRTSHPVEVEYSGDGGKGVVSVEPAGSGVCVPAPGSYTIRPRGCHKFSPPELVARTTTPSGDPPKLMSMEAVAHEVTVTVLSPIRVDDLMLTVTAGGRASDVGPLQPKPDPNGGFAFDHTMYMADGEMVEVSWRSAHVLVDPPQAQVWGTGSCQPRAVGARARPALTKAGAIRPAVADATVTLLADGVKLTQMTTEDGKYRFGPLDASKEYKITVEKESYVFSEPDAEGNVVAKKLAEITVQLLDDADGTPLQGALVSASGGSFRRALAADSGGRVRMSGLAPDRYYVKPHMKEYRFEPNHRIVPLPDGDHVHITLRGIRVAWSCVGTLSSLGGAGWAGAGVLAVPEAEGCALEHATTESNGNFRIRGLLPNCVYTIQLKESSAPELAGLKLVKAPASLEVKDKKDIDGVRLIGIQPSSLTDAVAVVYAPTDYYKTLRLTLTLDDAAKTPVFTTKLNPGEGGPSGQAIALPRLAARGYALRLQSSLSRATHVKDDAPVYFTADGGFKQFDMYFEPKVKSSEQELRQSSLLVVPLLGLAVLVYLNLGVVLDKVGGAVRAAKAVRSLRQRPDDVGPTPVPVPKKLAKKKFI